MKNIEKLAIVIIVLSIISTLATPLGQIIFSRVFGYETISDIRFMVHSMAMASAVIKPLVYIGIGIWLFILARKEENATPWIWLLFGIFGGILAPILFYLIKVYETVKTKDL